MGRSSNWFGEQYARWFGGSDNSAEPAPRQPKGTITAWCRDYGDQVHAFARYVRLAYQAGGFDHTTFSTLIDQAALDMISMMVPHTQTARENPFVSNWQTEWSIATILKAMEEA